MPKHRPTSTDQRNIRNDWQAHVAEAAKPLGAVIKVISVKPAKDDQTCIVLNAKGRKKPVFSMTVSGREGITPESLKRAAGLGAPGFL